VDECSYVRESNTVLDITEQVTSVNYSWTKQNYTHTAWVQKIPLRFLTLFPKWLGIFSPNLTCLLYVPIYARVQMFIQLSATMTKLCHIKRDHPVHIIYSKCPPSAEPPKRMLGGRFGSQNTVNEPSFGFLHSTSRKTYLMTFSSNQARSYAVRKVAFQSLGGSFCISSIYWLCHWITLLTEMTKI